MGADGVIVLPQLSVTVGAVGTTARAIHEMVDAALTGKVMTGAAIVYT